MKSRTILAYVVLFGMVGGQPIARGAPIAQPSVVASTSASTAASRASQTATGPAWASDARWYQIDVPMFARGKPGSSVGGPAGNLQGLRNRLPYLKALGVNVLYLTSIFQPSVEAMDHVDWRHIDPALGSSTADAPTSEPSQEQPAQGFTSADRSFLALVKTAHDAGFRIVLDLAVGDVPGSIGPAAHVVKDLVELSERWINPDGNTKTPDGVDGWVVRGARALPGKSIKAWTAEVRAQHPEVLLVADVDRASTNLVGANGFDTRVDRAYANAIRDFIGVAPQVMSARPFLAKLEAIGKKNSAGVRSNAPSALSDPVVGRFFRPGKSANAASQATASSGDNKQSSSPSPTSQAAARWRLATVLQHFLPGAPMTYYGDESGGTERHPEFASLIQWLHVRRGVDAPLRDGALRVAMVDKDRQVFVLARTLPDDEVILVVNYGNTRHKIMLSVGQPGRVAALLTPVLAPRRLPPVLARRLPAPANGVAPLPVGASRQGVDADGRIRVWVDPMAVRYILLQNQ